METKESQRLKTLTQQLKKSGVTNPKALATTILRKRNIVPTTSNISKEISKVEVSEKKKKKVIIQKKKNNIKKKK